MSEYCYLCEECNQFREFCNCKDGFKDPMAYWKSLSPEELMAVEEELK